MNISELCFHLKISPLIRKTGTDQEKSEEPMSEILLTNFRAVINSLPGGKSGESQGTITQAYFEASEALKGRLDLLYLIKTPEDLNRVLACIPLNEIQPLLIQLITRDPSQRSMIKAIFDTSWLDRFAGGVALVASGATGLVAGGYIAYRISTNAMKYMRAGAPESELDNIISSGSALKIALTGLPDEKICEALMVIRHIGKYQEFLSDAYQGEGSATSTIMGINIPINAFLDGAKNLISAHDFNKIRRLINDENKLDGMRTHLYDSSLLNRVEDAICDLFSEDDDKRRYIAVVISCLELINVLEKITLVGNGESAWRTQLDAYRRIQQLFKIIDIARIGLYQDLETSVARQLDEVFKLYLPKNFYSYLNSAIVTSVDDKTSHIFSSGRMNYYLNRSEEPASLIEWRGKIAGCLPQMRQLLLGVQSDDVIADHAAREDASAVLLVHKSEETKEREVYSDNASDEHGESSHSSDGEYAAKDFEEVDKSHLYPIRAFSCTQLIALRDELKSCLEKNCLNITARNGQMKNSRTVIQKKVAYLTRCYVSLEQLSFSDSSEDNDKNKDILAAVCVVSLLTSMMETNNISTLTQKASDGVDHLFSTRLNGTTTSREITVLLKKYGLIIYPGLLDNHQELIKIVRCFNDGIWPVLLGAMFHFEHALAVQEPTDELSVSVSSLSLFSYLPSVSFERLRTMVVPDYLRQNVAVFGEYCASFVTLGIFSRQVADSDSEEEKNDSEHSL